MFRIWIGLTVVVAIYIAVTGPLVTAFDEDMWLVAIVVPPLMILLLGLGLGWLAWVVTAPRRDRGQRDPEG
jgi:hypothetical protein